MLNKRYISILFIFSCTLFIISAKQALSDQEQQAIDDFLTFKVNITKQTKDDIIVCIDNYQKNLQKTSYNCYSKEVQLILDNFILMEKYSYLYLHNTDDCTLKSMIISQKEINDDWFATHDNNTINKWLYTTYADVISWSLQFLSKKEALKYSILSQDYYKTALKLDQNMTYALFGVAQWNIYVPAILGGGKTKAIKQFKQAVSASRNCEEKFYSYILLSQAYFEKNKKTEAAKTLKKAIEIQPNSEYIRFMQNLNKQDCSYFEYMTNRTSLKDKMNNNT